MSIRSLRPDEAVPSAPAARYYNDQGYVRLRWLISPGEYVEEYEHRIVMGRPGGHVHHLNGVKDDNRPENLLTMSGEDHGRLHGAANTGLYGKYRSRSAMESAMHAEARRIADAGRLAEMIRLYRSGLSTTEVGRSVGLDSSGVSRKLRAAGIEMRPRSRTFYVPAVDPGAVRRMHAEGVRVRAMAQRLGVGVRRINDALDYLGLSRFGPGKPNGSRSRDGKCTTLVNFIPEMREMGFVLDTGQDPLAESIMLHGEQGGFQVWLTDDGSYREDPPEVSL